LFLPKKKKKSKLSGWAQHLSYHYKPEFEKQ